MKLTVYSISGGPRPWRVLLGLAFKGLDYEIKYLEGSRGEHKLAPFRAINPRAKVPVLDADGLILRDSIGILAWLDREFPEPPLFGKTADEAASIWQITMECCDYLRDAAEGVLWPVAVMGEPLPEAGTEKRVTLEAAAEVLHEEYRFVEDLLEQKLKGLPYFGGQLPSAADAVIFPDIRNIQRAVEIQYETMDALGFGDLTTKYPRVTEWKSRLGDLPGVDKTMPRHW